MTLIFCFIFTTLLFLLFFYIGTGRNKSVLVASTTWIFIISGLSLGSFFKITDTMPPRFLVVLLGNIIFMVFAYQNLKSMKIEPNILLLIHILRIPIEMILYYLFIQKLVPEIMTFKGLNFDLIIGVSAFLILLLNWVFKIKIDGKIMLIWNVIGIFFLLNIVILAIFSAPLPFQLLSFDQPNIAVLRFPYILLPAIIVPIVFLSHFLGLKYFGSKK
jgi:hypothetical protein